MNIYQKSFLLISLPCLLLCNSSWSEILIKNCSWQQRWPWNGLVDITCTVECKDTNSDGSPVDIRLSFTGYDRVRRRTIEMKSFVGANSNLLIKAGAPRKITWNAAQDHPDFHSPDFKIRVTAVVQKK